MLPRDRDQTVVIQQRDRTLSSEEKLRFINRTGTASMMAIEDPNVDGVRNGCFAAFIILLGYEEASRDGAAAAGGE